MNRYEGTLCSLATAHLEVVYPRGEVFDVNPYFVGKVDSWH